MVLLHTPVCDFDTKAIDFALKDSAGKLYHLKDCQGEKGLLAMEQIAQTGRGPQEQTPSMGCSIKWSDQ
jgi:hypothetical protein